jgi:cytochrome c-type biogenesis protein CcmH/NrfF
MANGELIEEMRKIVSDDKAAVSQAACNRMVLAAIVQLYDKVEKLQPALNTYKILVWVVAAIATATIGGLVTGKLAVVFSP